ncbi:hypothetical protein [Egbenema bharatensis]|uniref:hypothetical protein n=1 Tax=Egbenema bharatensis TaxID=3463334 RepID=UPI003A89197C
MKRTWQANLCYYDLFDAAGIRFASPQQTRDWLVHFPNPSPLEMKLLILQQIWLARVPGDVAFHGLDRLILTVRSQA